MIMIARICEYTKNYWFVYFKLVNCIVCELYLNKVFFFPLNNQINKNQTEAKGGMQRNKQWS